MKKIIITEDQAKRLNILSDKGNPIEKIVQFSEIKTDVLNNLFNDIVNNSTLVDANKFDFKKIDEQISNIYDELMVLEKNATSYINDMSDEEFNGEDVIVDEAVSNVKEKLYIIKEIITALGDLAKIFKEENVFDKFKVNTPLDITDK